MNWRVWLHYERAQLERLTAPAREQRRAALERAAATVGEDAAPERSDPAATAYCPICRVEYRTQRECADCKVALAPFATPPSVM